MCCIPMCAYVGVRVVVFRIFDDTFCCYLKREEAVTVMLIKILLVRSGQEPRRTIVKMSRFGKETLCNLCNCGRQEFGSISTLALPVIFCVKVPGAQLFLGHAPYELKSSSNDHLSFPIAHLSRKDCTLPDAVRFKKETQGIKVEEGQEEYEVQEVRNVDKQWLPRDLVMDNFNAAVTIAIDDAEENEGQRINFRTLLSAGPEENADFLWNAFRSLVSWIYGQKYAADQSHTSHVNACIIAEILKAPRFMNRAMVEAVHSMKTREKDLRGNPNILRQNYRNIFALCKETSPIYRLYFETSIYWKLVFGAVAYPASGEIHLGLDPTADAALVYAHSEYKMSFCKFLTARCTTVLAYPRDHPNIPPLKEFSPRNN
ncbi:hypothetical protein BDZ45DRAFT_695690 [Acephala macrosclerotiorum]|nr:hypothetical protein BDZ45DRAFT_695690 [Acephala macrosclerotiorum]